VLGSIQQRQQAWHVFAGCHFSDPRCHVALVFFVQDLPYGNTEEMGDMVRVMDNEQNYRSIIAAQGAEFRGVQPGPPETLILFADPRLGRTLAVAESEFSSEAVSNRLEESRRAFDLELRVQRSLC
jgi:hypothetical protein